MPWARIPADKLINLPLFGIDVILDDGDFVWMRGPRGRMRVNKLLPKVFFETVADAHQAGAVGIQIGNEAEEAEYREYNERISREADELVDSDEIEPKSD